MSNLKLKFLGCGAGFNPNYGSNSAYLNLPDRGMLLLECGEQTFARLINLPDFLNAKYLIAIVSHTHSDHAGSLGNMVMHSYNVLHRRVTIVYGGLRQRRELRRLLNSFGVPRGCYRMVSVRRINDLINEHTNVDGHILVGMTPTKHTDLLACYSINIIQFCGRRQQDGIYWSGDTCEIEPMLPYLVSGYQIYQEVGVRHSPAHVNIQDLDKRLVKLADDDRCCRNSDVTTSDYDSNIDMTNFRCHPHSVAELRNRITVMHLDGQRALYYAELLGYKVPELV